MKKFYAGKFTYYFFKAEKSLTNKVLDYRKSILFRIVILLCFLQAFVTPDLSAQKLEFSYSYFNLTRNSGGGTLQQGDTIEVHALAKVNSTTNNFYYIDTIPAGTQYINNSIELITNEGVLFGGPYTNTT